MNKSLTASQKALLLTPICLVAILVISGCASTASRTGSGYSHLPDLFLRQARAELGDVVAQYDLARIYARRDYVALDNKKAMYWYSRAAEQGDALAQYNLGVMYHKGQGIPQDHGKAIYWYAKAAKRGIFQARANLEALEKERPGSTQISETRKIKPPKRPTKVAKPSPSHPPSGMGTSGSGFFVSRKGHVVTNQHIVSDCKKVTVGDNARKQVTAEVLGTDRRNDLALLRISNTKMASAETRSLIRKLGIKIVPLASDGLMRSEDVELGEDLLVAGYPYGETFSNTIKVTKGIVSAIRGLGDDSGQFQMDAAVQPGSSGGPIYDGNGNIVGVVVAQLNKMKFAKMSGSIPENVNFGIKASTVRQFLSSSGLATKWSRRSKSISTRELAKIAKNQTVMVVCYP